MRKSKFMVGLLTLCMSLILMGCGSSSQDMAISESVNSSYMSQEEAKSEVFYDSAVEFEEYGGEAEELPEDASGAESDAVTAEALSQRKLIKTVDMNVETKEFDQMMDSLESKIDELGGYIENLETYNGSSYSNHRSTRNANLTIRIPKNQLNTFLQTVEGISNVVRSTESVEDVTLTYVDLESHKTALMTEQTRLLELLERAESIEDIITIESRLSEVRYRIESMESQLRTYDNKIDYSTVYLYVEEVRELTPAAERNAVEQITDGFVESLKDIKDGLIEFAIWLVVNIPYFILWAVIFVLIVVLIKIFVKLLCMWNNKSKKKTEKNVKEDQVK